MAGYCSAPPSTLLAPITVAGGMLVTQYYSSDPPFVRNNNIWLSLQIPCYRPLNTKWPLYMAKITILQRRYTYTHNSSHNLRITIMCKWNSY